MSSKYKVTKWAYSLIFIEPQPLEYPTLPTSKVEKNVNPYLKYRGQIIRNIEISVFDPFGFSINDSMATYLNTVQLIGNKLHLRTKKWIIQNRLLFKESDSLNALAISETERMLREAIFINDAQIQILNIPGSDSVDVNVLVHDKWSLTFPVEVKEKLGNIRIRNTNFLGLGQQFEQFGEIEYPDKYVIRGFYNIANIDNSFASSKISYSINHESKGVSFSIDKPYFSPLTKWAGGLTADHSWNIFKYKKPTDTIIMQMPLHVLWLDSWAGKNFKTRSKKILFEQSSGIYTGIRYFKKHHLKRPSFQIDENKINLNSEAVIGNVGFAVQQYYKEKFIYRFGANEDVPEGFIVQFTYGVYKKELHKFRLYNGFELARAKHFKFGYLSATFMYGVFYNKKLPNDVTTDYKLYYFSDLFRKGKIFFRQFLSFNLIHGENKMEGSRITIKTEELYGFTTNYLGGNTKMIFNSETVMYLPFNIIGFRLAPVFSAGFGVLGDPINKIYNNTIYQGYLLGIMLRNENLLTSTALFSFGYYPLLPDGRINILNYNPILSFTLRVRAFAVTKPSFVSY